MSIILRLASGLFAPSALCWARIACASAIRSSGLPGMLTLICGGVKSESFLMCHLLIRMKIENLSKILFFGQELWLRLQSIEFVLQDFMSRTADFDFRA